MAIYITGTRIGDQLNYSTGDSNAIRSDLGIGSPIANVVYTTGNQEISGVKNFYERPTLNGTGFLLSGEANSVIGDYYPNNNPSGFITGVSQFAYISGDLDGNLLYPTLSHIQGNAISAASPSAGQTLQWNGTAWVPGSLPNGGNGGGGIVYYLNFANTSGIAPVSGLPTSPVAPSQLGRNYSVGSGSITSTNLTQGSYSLICGFVTASGDPGLTNIPAGLWDFNIWADIIGDSGGINQTQFQVRIYKYNSANGTYTSLANSDDVYIYDPVTIAQYVANVTMPQATILETDRIYVELWAQKNVHQSREIRFYFGSLHPSHVHTTLPSVAGNGVVKVINGVFQTPASKIIDNDIDAQAAVQQSKIQNLTGDLNALYPRSNPSGYITGVNLSSYVTTSQTGAFYPASNPSGFLTAVTVSGAYVASSITNISGATQINNMMQITQAGYNAITPAVNTLYIIVG
jgi:hypothetical protein